MYRVIRDGILTLTCQVYDEGVRGHSQGTYSYVLCNKRRDSDINMSGV